MMTKKIKHKLNFKNKEIFDYQSDFTSAKGGQRKRVFTAFKEGKKTTAFRGLCLCEYIKGEKYFVIRFTLRGQRNKKRVFTIGRFDNNLDVITGETKFGTKQCQERLFNIVKEHQDEYGKWIKDPNQTIVFKKMKKMVTIRKLIVDFAKKGFQKMQTAECLTGNSIRDKVRHLFGYNHRIRHLEYDNHDNGDGYVRFRVNLKDNKPAPKDWNELFKWYPAGKFILKDSYFNRNGIKSIYDDDISKINIEDLRSKLITNYVQQYTSHGAKKDVIECFRSLWHFAITEGYMEADERINPTYHVPNKKGRPTPNKYKLKIFEDEDLKLLLQVCDELSTRFPWQSDAIVLQALTGLRREECFKLKWKEHIDWKNDQIILGTGITKPGREEYIHMNEPIRTCLSNILKIRERHFTYNKGGYSKQRSFRNYPLAYSKHLPWVFCTTQVTEAKLLDPEYRKSKKTRLRSDKHCWDEIKSQMKITLKIPLKDEYLCTSKMLRKTFTHKTKMAFDGRSDISKRFTRHKDERILEGLYDGSTEAEDKANAQKLGKVFNFVKKRAV